MDNKIVMISIAAVIGIIVLGSVLMPILDDATDTQDTFTNTGLIYATDLNENTAMTMAWDHTKPSILTVNGVEKTMPTGSVWPLTIAFSDSFAVRVFPASNGYIQVLDTTTGAPTSAATVSAGTDMSITISGGTLSSTVGSTTKTYAITEGLVIADTGGYVLKNSDDAAYIKKDSTVYCAGYTYHGLGDSVNLVNIFSYDVENGIDIWGSYPPSITHTETYDQSQVTGYVDLYSFKSITMDITDSNSNTGTAVYSQVYVPVEVNAELSQHLTNGQNNILTAIPVMIILAILLGVVALVIRSRMD